MSRREKYAITRSIGSLTPASLALESLIMVTSRPAGVRLAELVAALSLGTDLGLGQPMEHVIRQTLIALRMSELLGLDEPERKVVYYSGLLAWVGCHTDAYEQAKWFGDDLTIKADGFLVADPGPSRSQGSAAAPPSTPPWSSCSARGPRSCWLISRR
jgi:hypothetical protein